ncbi:DUF3883 domain-containing protein [Hydrogenophaga sp. 2FB]|uniref:DUF3883 domain-containing protein n=1 Tax=Hydrogenophaga sp. 2FB TaxID=2502187 RepID=UPI0010F5DFC6|nr:DUF3883 domain-containing protein [Hydrogenophaga sp. 2FB]
MTGKDWSREEVEATVRDYLSMLSSWLAGTPFNKSAHRRALMPLLNGRSEQSIEFKHRNISAALIDSNFPYIPGYRQLPNYQGLIAEVLAELLPNSTSLLSIAAADADSPIVVPEVDDILAILTSKPYAATEPHGVREAQPPLMQLSTNYVEREARNRSLGTAGELFVLNYETARLIHAGKESLASRIEHTSVVTGDHAGFDILSFEESGAERLIEVKTTKYGFETPFFVTRNEVAKSEVRAQQYQLYRLFDFKAAPRLYVLPGAIGASCALSAASFVARPR